MLATEVAYWLRTGPKAHRPGMGGVHGPGRYG